MPNAFDMTAEKNNCRIIKELTITVVKHFVFAYIKVF